MRRHLRTGALRLANVSLSPEAVELDHAFTVDYVRRCIVFASGNCGTCDRLGRLWNCQQEVLDLGKKPCGIGPVYHSDAFHAQSHGGGFASTGGAHLRMVQSFMQGDWSIENTDNRTELWKQTYQAIESKGGLIFGLGHGSMMGVVDTRYGGLAPHNYYLYVLGNSGIFALLMLLVFEAVLFQQGWKSKQRDVRAAVLAIAIIVAVVHIFDHTLLTYPFTGVLLACTTLAVAYSNRPTVEAERQFGRASNAPSISRGIVLRPQRH